MATLILIRLDCAEQEDITFDDSIRIVVNGKTAWTGSMDTNEQKNLGNKAVPFQNSAIIKLFEEDWPDGDDDLGTVTVTEQGTVASARAARFTGDGADYTLWYSVYGDNRPEDLPPPPPEPGTPPAPANPGATPPPVGPGGVGDPAAPCALGHPIIEVTDPVEGKPVQGANVRILARGAQGITGADGKCDLGLVLPGEVVVEAYQDQYFPFPAARRSVIKDCRQGDTLIQLNLSKAQVVDVTPGNVKWYINLDADESQNRGREVTIRARISTPAAGVRVHWQLNPDPNNRAGLPAHAQAKVRDDFTLTDDQGVATTKLTLSAYGGDRFQVSASLSPGTRPGTQGAKESGWIEVWRKVFYDITQMKKPGGGQWEMPAATMGQVATAMGKVFIEMQQAGPVNNVNESVANFDTANDAYDWADKFTSNRCVPWKIHYVVVGYSCNRLDKELEVPVNTMVATLAPRFRPYDFNGTNPIVKAQYQPAGGGTWRDFPAGKVTLVGANPRRQIRVDFNGTGVNPVTAPQKVKVKYIEASGANGWGGSSLHLIICRGTFDEYYTGMDLAPIMAGTCIHEPGHSLGLVMEGQTWEFTDPEHRNHCMHQTCVMWWQGYVGRPHDFHPTNVSDPGCHTHMRGLDMSREKIKAYWGFPRS